MSATRTVTSLLDGRPVEGAPGGTLTIPNPARLDQMVAEAHLGDAGTFLEACRRAKAAQPGWAGIPAPVRGRAIQNLGRLVEDNFEALSQLITREIGKPIKESRGEVQEVIDTCNFFLGEGRRLYGQTVPTDFRVPVQTANDPPKRQQRRVVRGARRDACSLTGTSGSLMGVRSPASSLYVVTFRTIRRHRPARRALRGGACAPRLR